MNNGDAVEIKFYDQSKPGKILLASRNGMSLMLEFEGVLGAHVGMMPVLMGVDGAYRSIMTDQPVTIRRSLTA